MNIHEFQAKKLLADRDIPIPRGALAQAPGEAVTVAQDLGGSRWVLKAQIHAGGRGEGHFQDHPNDKGGIRVVDSIDEVRANADQMLGHVLITKQTGAAGTEVKRLYIEQACDAKREMYLGLSLDRASSHLTFIASVVGGIAIESIAETSPASIKKVSVDPAEGLTDSIVDQLVSHLQLDGGHYDAAANIIRTMYQMYIDLDAAMMEINPLGLTNNGELIALDAAVTFDDNALYRHPEISELRDESELRIGELKAVHHGLNYVKLDGNVGFMASGAGLAMATIDAIRLLGGNPASFLDVPPAASVDRVRDALRLLLSDPDVKSILVNVFGGGIMRCDTIADGIILANRESPIEVPMVVRLAGTSAEYAKQRLRDSGPSIVFADDMADAAQKAVGAAREIRKETRRTWWERMQGTFAKSGT